MKTAGQMTITMMMRSCLLGAECFACVSLFNSHSNPLGWKLELSPLSRWGK